MVVKHLQLGRVTLPSRIRYRQGMDAKLAKQGGFFALGLTVQVQP